MPEGDSVWRAARELHSALAGRVLVSSDFRVPRFATLNLAGWTVLEALPRGKHLLIRVQPPAVGSPGGLTIHSHLKMEGSWQVYPTGGKWRKPGHTARCVLRTAESDVVGFSLGILEVIPTAAEEKTLGHLGPDLLGPEWDSDKALRRMLAWPKTPVGVVLLDQRVMAGVGNIYRCEACFLAGIHPSTPVASVPDPAELIGFAHELLQANRGSGIRNTLGPRAAALGVRPGYWVYGRQHQPCRRCGTPVRRELLGTRDVLGTDGLTSGGVGEERNIFFCPTCQPPPRAEVGA
ncbi:DNA-formamidopyrimidine glycosylase family protein [Pseudarthrobacter sp. J1738]|uniref:DNA-formamidopyrimidine glycosylase family protein n=1 Tax=Pseudarthrobacter sp. J1738 TaxID=3420446 RepID=UPI003D27A8EB